MQNWGDFADVQYLSAFDALWERHYKCIVRVQDATPPNLTLRQKDQYLYSRSFACQLLRDIEASFRQVDLS